MNMQAEIETVGQLVDAVETLRAEDDRAGRAADAETPSRAATSSPSSMR